MNALKCKTLGAELAMRNNRSDMYICLEKVHIDALLTSDDHYLLLTLIGKGRQTNLPCGNFNELQMADLKTKKG